MRPRLLDLFVNRLGRTYSDVPDPLEPLRAALAKPTEADQ